MPRARAGKPVRRLPGPRGRPRQRRRRARREGDPAHPAHALSDRPSRRRGAEGPDVHARLRLGRAGRTDGGPRVAWERAREAVDKAGDVREGRELGGGPRALRAFLHALSRQGSPGRSAPADAGPRGGADASPPRASRTRRSGASTRWRARRSDPARRRISPWRRASSAEIRPTPSGSPSRPGRPAGRRRASRSPPSRADRARAGRGRSRDGPTPDGRGRTDAARSPVALGPPRPDGGGAPRSRAAGGGAAPRRGRGATRRPESPRGRTGGDAETASRALAAAERWEEALAGLGAAPKAGEDAAGARAELLARVLVDSGGTRECVSGVPRRGSRRGREHGDPAVRRRRLSPSPLPRGSPFRAARSRAKRRGGLSRAVCATDPSRAILVALARSFEWTGDRRKALDLLEGGRATLRRGRAGPRSRSRGRSKGTVSSREPSPSRRKPPRRARTAPDAWRTLAEIRNALGQKAEAAAASRRAADVERELAAAWRDEGRRRPGGAAAAPPSNR